MNSGANGIEPLVEVVTSRELDVALSVGARVIGVNNRFSDEWRCRVNRQMRPLLVTTASLLEARS